MISTAETERRAVRGGSGRRAAGRRKTPASGKNVTAWRVDCVGRIIELERVIALEQSRKAEMEERIAGMKDTEERLRIELADSLLAEDLKSAVIDGRAVKVVAAERIDIAVGVGELPRQFCRLVRKVVADRHRLKKALKEGDSVTGVTLVRVQRALIR